MSSQVAPVGSEVIDHMAKKKGKAGVTPTPRVPRLSRSKANPHTPARNTQQTGIPALNTRTTQSAS